MRVERQAGERLQTPTKQVEISFVRKAAKEGCRQLTVVLEEEEIVVRERKDSRNVHDALHPIQLFYTKKKL